MSKAARISIFILIILILIISATAGYFLLESQKIKEENFKISQQLNQSQDREKKAVSDNKKMNDDLRNLSEERNKLQEKVQKAEKQVEEIYSQVTELTQDRDTWKKRVNEITTERNDVVAKIRSLEENLAQKDKQLRAAKAKKDNESEDQPKLATRSKEIYVTPEADATLSASTSSSSNDQYWADVLKQKAELEVKIENLNQEFMKKTSELVELKQANADFKLKLEGLMHDKDQLTHDIQYKADMVNNLSLELARTKNDKKFVADRVLKLNEENLALRGQLKQLVSSKGSLEKSILKLSQDKGTLQKQLVQTETMIQGKIDEIWDIKQNLDESADSIRKSSSSNEIELPPIVVSSDGQSSAPATGPNGVGFNGKIVSLNPENNFVIVDLGEKSGIGVGDVLSVYRDGKYIARLEVIQVRKEISAADIKDQWTKIQVGDSVK